MTTTIYVRLTDDSQAAAFAYAIGPIVKRYGGGSISHRNSRDCYQLDEAEKQMLEKAFSRSEPVPSGSKLSSMADGSDLTGWNENAIDGRDMCFSIPVGMAVSVKCDEVNPWDRPRYVVQMRSRKFAHDLTEQQLAQLFDILGLTDPGKRAEQWTIVMKWGPEGSTRIHGEAIMVPELLKH